jgi:hypothetical protein
MFTAGTSTVALLARITKSVPSLSRTAETMAATANASGAKISVFMA